MKRLFFLPLVLGYVLCLGFLAAPQRAQAWTQAMTQRDYIKWMVQLTGDNRLFDSSSTDADYIQWANKQSMAPLSSQTGWKLGAPLTQAVLAETLVQFFNLGQPKTGSDYVRLLLREGIVLPNMTKISREAFAGLVDDYGFNSRTWSTASCNLSPIKPPPKPPKPPGSPKPPKPPKPHHHPKWWGWWH